MKPILKCYTEVFYDRGRLRKSVIVSDGKSIVGKVVPVRSNV